MREDTEAEMAGGVGDGRDARSARPRVKSRKGGFQEISLLCAFPGIVLTVVQYCISTHFAAFCMTAAKLKAVCGEECEVSPASSSRLVSSLGSDLCRPLWLLLEEVILTHWPVARCGRVLVEVTTEYAAES